MDLCRNIAVDGLFTGKKDLLRLPSIGEGVTNWFPTAGEQPPGARSTPRGGRLPVEGLARIQRRCEGYRPVVERIPADSSAPSADLARFSCASLTL